MNNGRRQDLSEAFTSIISMLLGTIRARGWRGLKDLPKIWLVTTVVRGYGEAFAALVADFRAGKLHPPAPVPAPVPAPAPWTDAPVREARSAQPPAPHCPAGRPDPVARERRQPAKRPSSPAVAAGPDRPRADRVRFASVRPRARGRTAVWLRPPRRALDPFAVFRLPTGIFATGRST